jgi:hypothetical protein
MNTKIILAAIVGGILYFLLGWLIYGFLLMDFFAENTKQYEGLMYEMPNLLLVFLSNLSLSYLLAFIFQKWASIKTISRGFSAGFLIGLLLSISIDLMFHASMDFYTPTAVVVDIIANSVIIALVGGSIGWILGIEKKTEK